MLKTVLFDLDGTLVDTAPDLARTLNLVRQEQGLAEMSYADIRSAVSHGSKALITRGFELDEHDAQFEKLRQRLLELYMDNMCIESKLFPHMGDTLDTLEDMGLNWGIVTNKPKRMTEPLVASLGLSKRAVCIVSGDSVEQSKPHPAPMYYACKLAGSEPHNCLYVGDAERDIIAGREAGMTTVAALYGYIDDHENPQDWQADGMIKQPADLLPWLKQHLDKG